MLHPMLHPPAAGLGLSGTAPPCCRKGTERLASVSLSPFPARRARQLCQCGGGSRVPDLPLPPGSAAALPLYTFIEEAMADKVIGIDLGTTNSVVAVMEGGD